MNLSLSHRVCDSVTNLAIYGRVSSEFVTVNTRTIDNHQSFVKFNPSLYQEVDVNGRRAALDAGDSMALGDSPLASLV